ncbi:MAG: hypothetical protein ACF8NJ_08150 [Phycisphaerales bacterium JB038]
MSLPDLTGRELDDLDAFARWCYQYLPGWIRRRWPASDPDDVVQSLLESCLARAWFEQMRDHTNPTAFLLRAVRNTVLADGRREQRRLRRERRASAGRAVPSRRAVSATLDRLDLAETVKRAVLQMQREMTAEGMSVYFAVFYEATILPLVVDAKASHDDIARRYKLSSRAVVGRAAASGRRRLAGMLGEQLEGVVIP